MCEACKVEKFTNRNFINDVIDGMYDWVRVIDKDSNIVFLNKAMAEGLGNYPIGKKCYSLLGKTGPCENCISRNAIFDGKSHEKEEIIGDRIFSVMSSPLKDEQGEVIAAIEVLRDVTQVRQLQNKILEQNNKLNQDLDTAKKLQRSLLPWNYNNERLSFSFLYYPCETLGGDFFDIFNIDEDHVGMYIADVSGHGVPASMLTVFLRSSINRKATSPSEALTKLYEDFNNSNIFNDMYITVFYVIINLKSRTITYSNAGHNVVPVVFNRGMKDRFELLNSPGIPISNWLPSPGYHNKSLSFMKDDRLFMYTDGVIEIRNSHNEQFGEERLLEILLNDFPTPHMTLNKVMERVKDFIGNDRYSEYCDDITMALMQLS